VALSLVWCVGILAGLARSLRPASLASASKPTSYDGWEHRRD
jgi:hypothetical protein